MTPSELLPGIDDITYCSISDYEKFFISKKIKDLELKNGKQSNFYILQHTGLKDKNGKEIFEGDVVKQVIKGVKPDKTYKMKHGEILGFDPIVGVPDKEYVFEVLIDHQYGTHPFSDEEAYEYSNDPKKFEVIGNIYQNPELLEGNK